MPKRVENEIEIDWEGVQRTIELSLRATNSPGGSAQIRHASVPSAPVSMEAMTRGVQAVKSHYPFKRRWIPTQLPRGEAHRDLLHRKMYDSYDEVIIDVINATIAGGLDDIVGNLTRRQMNPARRHITPETLCAFIEAIPQLPSASTVTEDLQLHAIAMARAVYDKSKTDRDPAELNQIGAAVMKAIRKPATEDAPSTHISQTREQRGHSLDWKKAENAASRIVAACDRAVPFLRLGGVTALLATRTVGVPLLYAGTAVFGHKEDKAENKLMNWGMDVMATLREKRAPMSADFLDAARLVEEHNGTGKHEREFALALWQSSQSEQVLRLGQVAERFTWDMRPPYDDDWVLRRRLHQPFSASMVRNIVFRINEAIEPDVPSDLPRLQRDIRRNRFRDFKLENLCTYIEAIPKFSPDKFVWTDGQMTAIALARAVFDARKFGAADLNRVGEALMNAIRPDETDHISQPRQRTHFGPSENKPENKLMRWSMEIMTQLARKGMPMSEGFLAAAKLVDELNDPGKCAGEFRTALKHTQEVTARATVTELSEQV